MDEDTKELAKIAADAAVKPFDDLLTKLLGPSFEAIGGRWGDFWKDWREKHAKKLFQKVEKTIQEKDVVTEPISPKVFHSIVEEASYEDDEDLHTRWANMLVNAADSRQETPVSPMFSYILRDFGPKEVKFLDALYADALKKLETHVIFKDVSQMPYDLPSLMELYRTLGFATAPNLGSPNFQEQQHPDFRRDRNAFFLMLDVIRRHDVIREVLVPREKDEIDHPSGSMKRVYHFSVLGIAFVKACHPPSKAGT